MDIKFKDNPITIKTIEVGGKKLTKQFLQQIPRGHYVYSYNDGDKHSSYGVFRADNNELCDYFFDGEILGWINLKLESYSDIKKWASSTNEQMNNYSAEFMLILYINSSGELMRSYLDRLSILVIDKPIDQIYI